MADKPEVVTFTLLNGAKVTTTKQQALRLGWSEPTRATPRPRTTRKK